MVCKIPFAPNSPIFQKGFADEEDGENSQIEVGDDLGVWVPNLQIV